MTVKKTTKTTRKTKQGRITKTGQFPHCLESFHFFSLFNSLVDTTVHVSRAGSARQPALVSERHIHLQHYETDIQPTKICLCQCRLYSMFSCLIPWKQITKCSWHCTPTVGVRCTTEIWNNWKAEPGYSHISLAVQTPRLGLHC